MKINKDYTDHESGLHIDKGTEIEIADFVAQGDGREWVEVILPDGKHETVLASAVSA